MFIEQIFELRGPNRSLGRICTSITGCFHEKTIISQENIRLNCYLLLKCCRRQCSLLPPIWAKSRTKLNPKMKDFKRDLGLNCNQKEDWTTNIFNWLSNVKNLELSNGSEYVRNVMQRYQNSFFFKQFWKIAQRLGAPPPDPVCDTFELTVHFFTQQFR